MREKPGVFKLLWHLSQLPHFYVLTVLLRVFFPVMSRVSVLWIIYRPWALKAHNERERIAFYVIRDLREISPEAYRSSGFWFRG